METVWIIVSENTYVGARIAGVCSSKKKAEAVLAAMNHIGRWGELFIAEFNLDSVCRDVILKLEQEIEEGEEAKRLLEKLKES